jgi:hypothetical protein
LIPEIPNWREEIRSELLSGTDGPSEKLPKLDKTCALVDLSEDTDEEGEDDEEFNAITKFHIT